MTLSFGSSDCPKGSSDVRAVDSPSNGETPEKASPESESRDLERATIIRPCDVDLLSEGGMLGEVESVTVRKVHHPRFRLDWIETKNSVGSTPDAIRLTLVYEPDPKISRVINLSEALEGLPEKYRIESKLVGIVNSPSPDLRGIQYEIDFVLRELTSSLLITEAPLTLPYQNRASKHREPITLQRRFAPEVSEFFRGINRHSFLLTRGEELLAEFVSVDDGNALLSAYVNIGGAPSPLPLFDQEGQALSIDAFQMEVFELVYPLLRSKFAPLGQVLTYISDQVHSRQVTSLWHGNEPIRKKKRGESPAILASSCDWLRVTQAAHDSLRFGERAVRREPQMVAPSAPIDQLYMAGNHRALPTAIGGQVQLFPLNDERKTLVRFVANSTRKPAVFLEGVISAEIEHVEQRVSRFVNSPNERFVADGISHLLDQKSSNIRLFGSVVSDSYSVKARELLSHLNRTIPDNHQLHFGFASDVLPSLGEKPAEAAVDILLGWIPLFSIIEDRSPGEYSVCQLNVDSDGNGRISFYSRLGAELGFSTHGTPPESCNLYDALAHLYRTFIEDPDALKRVLPECPGVRLHRCSEEPFAHSDSKIQLSRLAEEWWSAVPTFGYGSDELFPVLTRDQVRWLSYDSAVVRLPLPQCSPFEEVTCIISPTGITSVEIKERNVSKFHGHSIVRVEALESGEISPHLVTSVVVALSARGLLPSRAHMECEKVFRKDQFHYERIDAPVKDPPKSAGIVDYLKEWFLRMRFRLPW